jgi:hypothetical protein
MAMQIWSELHGVGLKAVEVLRQALADEPG